MFSVHQTNEEKIKLTLNTKELTPFLFNHQSNINKEKNTVNSLPFDGIYKNKCGFSFPLNINIANYPDNVDEFDTNNGLSWKNNEGIPNVILSGPLFEDDMPIYPNDTEISLYDTIQVLKLFL